MWLRISFTRNRELGMMEPSMVGDFRKFQAKRSRRDERESVIRDLEVISIVLHQVL
jgi:hypothetical protein